MSEWLKEADCKSAGSAYVGSNPTLPIAKNIMSSFFPLFSSIINVSHLDDMPELFDYVENQSFDFQGNVTNNISSSSLQSDDLYLLDKFPQYKEVFLNEFIDFKNKVLRYTNTDFRITTSWSTKSVKGSQGSLHKHSNNYYSGVFYFGEVDELTAPIEFTGLFNSPTDFCFEAEEYNIYNSSSWTITPEKNMLIFFPAYLIHRIGLHMSDNPRYSIAFNVMPKTPYGSRDNQVR